MLFCSFSPLWQKMNDNIRQRQAEGIAAAKAKGVRFGKPMIPLPENFHELYQEWQESRISVEELARICNMGRSTIYRRINEYRNFLNQNIEEKIKFFQKLLSYFDIVRYYKRQEVFKVIQINCTLLDRSPACPKVYL